MNRFKPTALASFAAACLALVAVSAQPAAAGLVGHWTFDADFSDSEGTHHGAATGAVIVPGGKAGGAASFDGDNDRVVISKAVIPSRTFSISFWEFSPSTPENTGYFVGAGSDAEGYKELFLRRYYNGTTYGSGYGGAIDVDRPASFGDFGTFARGAWRHHVVTYDSAGWGRWYIDGEWARTQNYASAFNGLTADLYLGNRKDLGRDFLGLIDDLQIYNTAVRPAMVRALMDQPGKTLNEMFVPVLDNPSFEQPRLAHSTSTGPDAVNHVAADPAGWSRGWTDSSGTAQSVYHMRPGGETGSGLKSNGGHFYDMTDGDQGLGMILRSGSVTEAWVYQSLGTVTADQIGLTFMATVDTSVRYQNGILSNAERRISFRSGVTEGRNGNSGVLESMGLASATRIATSDDPFTTLVELFRPTPADVGKEIFLVVSVYDLTPASVSDQYQFDNVTLSVVPEPAAWVLGAAGLAGLLAVGRRRRKW